MIEQQDYKCNLTGLSIKFADSAYDLQHGGATASLDRIDSRKPYIIGNLQWIHKKVNRMKMDIDQKTFIEFCHLISIHNS